MDLESKRTKSWLGKTPQQTFSLLFLFLIVSAFGGVYLYSTWHNYQDMAKEDALHLVTSLEAFLSGTIHDNTLIKQSLNRLVEKNKSIHNAYFLAKDNDQYIITKDSREDTITFNELSVFTEPTTTTTPCGTWIRVLAPLTNPLTGQVDAILGLSYLASQWQATIKDKMIPHFLSVISVIFLLLVLLKFWFEHSYLKLRNEALYQTLFDDAPIGIILLTTNEATKNVKILSANLVAESILGRTRQELTQTTFHGPKQGPLFSKAQLEAFLPQGVEHYSAEHLINGPAGSTTWVNINFSKLVDGITKDTFYFCILEDIATRKDIESSLRESERSKAVLLAHLPGMAYRALYDRNWTLEFASDGCLALTGYASESLLYNRDIAYNEIIAPEYQQLVWDEWTRCLLQKRDFNLEYELLTKCGQRKWVLELGQGVFDHNGEVTALEGIILDVTDHKRRQATISSLRKHDFLTGLYNRIHLEKVKSALDTKKRLPLSVIICDIDGLRMINDVYGHAEGDRAIVEVAQLLTYICRSQDKLGRLSGGEFMFILPNTTNGEAGRIVEAISATFDSFNRSKDSPFYEISITSGYSTKTSVEQELEDVIKIAEEYLRNRKLLKQNSSHHAIVSSVMATLYAKSQETQEHGQRLGELSALIGEKLNLDQGSLDDLKLLSMLHDIGKIGVDDQILNKPGKLTSEEWEQMTLHPEIGHRIAMSTPHLEHIAKYILHHHERWDGTGYPHGLAGEEIPLASRILTVVDAYDAMTQDRIYHKAITKEEALAEIAQNAGTQFDPNIARIFVNLKRLETVI